MNEYINAFLFFFFSCLIDDTNIDIDFSITHIMLDLQKVQNQK